MQTHWEKPGVPGLWKQQDGGYIHILYLYILTPRELQKGKIHLIQNQMLDINLLR